MKKPKRELDDWPPIGLGPIVMQRQAYAPKDGWNTLLAKNRQAVLAWGADRIVEYTRATLDSTFLAIHLRLHQPTTAEMNELIADILEGKVKAKPRPTKKWLSPQASEVLEHWYKVIREGIERGDANYEALPRFLGARLETKADRTRAARLSAKAVFGIARREVNKRGKKTDA